MRKIKIFKKLTKRGRQQILSKMFLALIGLTIGLALLHIPMRALIAGDKSQFTPFEFLAPTLGAWLGVWLGSATVLMTKLVDMILTGNYSLVSLLRLFPLIGAAIYFGSRGPRMKIGSSALSLAAILLFLIHPVGRQVWFYSLFWLIPTIASRAKDNLFFNALGATFTAHSIGGVLFLYALKVPAEIWIALVPVVIGERLLFALGITLTDLVIGYLVGLVPKRSPAFKRLAKALPIA